MKISFENDIVSMNDEKIILINLLGVLEALKNNCLSIDEAEKYIFSPHTISKLKAKKCSERIVLIIEKGCELDDIRSLLPDKLIDVINEIEGDIYEKLNEYQEFNSDFWIKE